MTVPRYAVLRWRWVLRKGCRSTLLLLPLGTCMMIYKVGGHRYSLIHLRSCAIERNKMKMTTRWQLHRSCRTGGAQLPQTRARMNPPIDANPIPSGSLGARTSPRASRVWRQPDYPETASKTHSAPQQAKTLSCSHSALTRSHTLRHTTVPT